MTGAPRERRLEQVYAARSNDELRDLYDAWAGDYDQDLLAFAYTHPPVIAALVARYVADRDAAILDAGVGTGLIGDILAILGYRQLTGIDLSDGMLAIARAKGVYATLKNQVLGAPLDFADGHFAATISAGVLTTGHAPPSSLDELVRVTRRGGHLIFTLSLPMYEQGGFRPKLEALTAAGRWREVETTRSWRPLPGAPAESTIDARAHVFEVL